MNNVKNRFKLNQNSHTIRFGQALAPFGTGAMVDFKDQTLMAATPEYWTQYSEIHDERLEKQLNVDKFYLPPDKDSISGLPFVRFPQWYFCPKCKAFKPLKQWQKDFKPSKRAKDENMKIPKCMECNVQLVPTGIVIACENGHIDDFPWEKWVHIKDKKKPVCSNPILKIKNNSSALGLEGLIIECTTCGAKASMKGSFDKEVFEKLGKDYICTGNMPWKGKKEKCNLYPRAIQRGAMNIYFPKIVSSIVIPPYSSEINGLVLQSKKYNLLLETLKDEEYVAFKGKEDIIKSFIQKIADEVHQNVNVIEIIVNKKLMSDDKKSVATRDEYREEEYNALIGNIPKQCMSEKDFKIELQNVEKYRIDEISRVTLVKKLREVRALVGFTRINPPEQISISGFDDDQNEKFVKIKEKQTNWYPGYETRGEGVFIELNEDKINKWIENNKEVQERAKILNLRYNDVQKKYGNLIRKISPKFILLHTLAHLLIKELSFECGYSSASLTERIYCNINENIKKMCGILIYTASGDSEGTLGGLVRQGKADMLTRVIKNAIRKARWCSSDPVCIESISQGRDGLNLSACHACTLISETSCEEFNVLLDRALIVGTLDNPKVGFFYDL